MQVLERASRLSASIAVVALSTLFFAVYATANDVYVTNQLDNDVSQYDIGAGGSLSPKTAAIVGAGSAPSGIALSPDGRSAYVANLLSNNVSQYDVAADGSLSPKSTPTVAAGTGPGGIALSPDGRSAYVSNSTSDNVSQYDVKADGSLSPKTTATVAAGDEPQDIDLSSDGKSAYVPNLLGDNVSQYDVAADGSLSPKSPATVGAGDGPVQFALSPDGRSAYAANRNSNDVSQYDVSAGGSLSAKTIVTVGAGTAPLAVAVSPDGRSAYVANSLSDDISQYNVAADGSLSPKITATVSAGDAPTGIIVAFRPIATPAPTALTFGTPTPTPEGTLSPPQTVTFTNTGNAPLSIRGFNFSGVNPDDFMISSDDCGGDIAPGELCSAQIRFAPSAEGARSAILTALTNALGDPTVSLSGTAGPLQTGATGPSFSKLTRNLVKVPSSRRIRAVRVNCRGGKCRIRKATAFFVVDGMVFSGKTTFKKSTFASGRSAVITVVMPQRVYNRLKARKSGSLNVKVLATSSNGTRNQNTLRNGLRR